MIEEEIIETEEAPPTVQPPRLTVKDFAAKVKAKYPQYKDIDDKELTDKIILKHPEYKETIDFGTEKKNKVLSNVSAKPLESGLSGTPKVEKSNEPIPYDEKIFTGGVAIEKQKAPELSAFKDSNEWRTKMIDHVERESIATGKIPSVKDYFPQPISDNTRVAPRERRNTLEQFSNQNKQKAEGNKKLYDEAVENTAKKVIEQRVKHIEKKKEGEEVNPFDFISMNMEKKRLRDALEKGELAFGMDKEGKPGLKQTVGFWENVSKKLNDAKEANVWAEKFKDATPDEKVWMLEEQNQRLNENPEYIGVKESPAASVGGVIAEQLPFMGKAIGGGLLGGLTMGLPTMGAFLATSKDAVNIGATDEIIRRFEYLKKQNPNGDNVELMKQAENGYWMGAASGLATNAILTGTSLKVPLSLEGKNVLSKAISKTIGTGVHMGATTSLVEGAKLGEGNLEGIDATGEDIAKSMAKTFVEQGTLGSALHIVMSGVPKVLKSAAKFALKDAKPEDIAAVLKMNEDAGTIPPGTAEKVQAELANYKKASEKTIEGLPPEVEASVTGLIEAKMNLEAEAKTKDSSLKEHYDSKIEAIDNQIKKIIQTGKPYAYELNQVGEKYTAPEGITVQPPMTVPEPITVSGEFKVPKGIEVQEPMKVPEPITIGEKGTPKEEVITETEPIPEVKEPSGVQNNPSNWRSNIEALVHPETGLGATVKKILNEQQPLKDAFLKRIGLSIEDYKKLDEAGKEKVQQQWIKSKEFNELEKQEPSGVSGEVDLIKKGKDETNNYEAFKKEKGITDNDISTIPIDELNDYSTIDRTKKGQRGENAETTVNNLFESINQFGLTTPIHLKTDGKNFIIEDGETRLAAINKLGLKDVPVYVEKVDNFSEREQRLISEKKPIQNEEAKLTEPTIKEAEGGETKEVVSEPVEEKAGATKENDELIGITHAETDAVAKELGLPEYEVKPETVKEWDAEVDRRLAENPKAIQEMMDKYRAGGKVDKYDQRMMLKYHAALKARINKNPTTENLKQYAEAKRLSDIEGGREVAKSLVARKGVVPVEDNLANFLVDEANAAGVETLPQEKINEYKKKYEADQEVINQLNAKIAKLEEDKANSEAATELAKEAKKTKKVSKDFKATRQSLKDKLKQQFEEYKAAGQKMGIASDGGAESFVLSVDMAKTIGEYVKTYLEEGAVKLADVVSKVYEEIKDLHPSLTERDVRDVIAGKYAEKKQTRNEVAINMRNLKIQQTLLDKIEKLENGEKLEKKPIVRQRIGEEVQKLKDRFKELGGEEISDESKLQSYKTGLKNKIAKLEKDLETGDFMKEPEPKKPLQLDEEALKLKDQHIRFVKETALRRAKEEFARRGKAERTYDYVMQALGVKRIVQTAIDLSMPFRQGVTLALNPRRWDTFYKANKAMMQSVGNPKKFDRIMYDIHKSADYQNMLKDDVHFNEMDAVDSNSRNEDFQKSFLYKIPIIREPLLASNRAADGFLNVARYDMYMKGKKMLMKQGMTRENSPEAYKALGGWIMNMTGRGKLAKWIEDSHAGRVLASNTFFGARLMASRFNLLNPIYYKNLPKGVQIEAWKDIGSYVGMVMVTALAAKAAGMDVSTDPDSSDFLKLKKGDTRYDITGGMAQYVRTALRIEDAIAARINPKVSKSEANDKAENAFKSLAKFFQYKLAPNTSYGASAYFGEDALGNEFDPKDALEIYPMYVDDMVTAYKQNGITSLATVGLPSLLGVGVQTYKEKPKKAKKEPAKEKKPRKPKEYPGN